MEGNNKEHYTSMIEDLLEKAKEYANGEGLGDLELARQFLERAQKTINSQGLPNVWEEKISKIENSIYENLMEEYIEDFKKAAELGDPHMMEDILGKIVKSPVKYNIAPLKDYMITGYKKGIKIVDEKAKCWEEVGFKDLKNSLEKEARSYQEKLEILNKEGIEGILEKLGL